MCVPCRGTETLLERKIKRSRTLTLDHCTSSSSQNSTLFVENFVVEGNYAEISMRGIQVQNQGKLEVHLSGGDISIVDVSLGDNANLNVRSDEMDLKYQLQLVVHVSEKEERAAGANHIYRKATCSFDISISPFLSFSKTSKQSSLSNVINLF